MQADFQVGLMRRCREPEGEAENEIGFYVPSVRMACRAGCTRECTWREFVRRQSQPRIRLRFVGGRAEACVLPVDPYISLKGCFRPVSGTIAAIIMGGFAFATLILVQFRQLMREVARTAEEWRKLKRVLLRKDPDVDSHAGKSCGERPTDRGE